MNDKLDQEKLFDEVTWLARTSALGCVVGGMAHEMNNIFGRILGFAELSMEEDVSEETKEFLTEVRDSVLQITELSRWLGRFSRRRAKSAKPVLVSVVIDKAQDILAPEMKAESVRFVVTKDEELTLNGDDVLLSQALTQCALVLFSLAKGTKAINLLAKGEGKNLLLELSAEGGELDEEELKNKLQLSVPSAPANRTARPIKDVLDSYSLLVPRAIAQFHGGELTAEGKNLVITLPLA